MFHKATSLFCQNQAAKLTRQQAEPWKTSVSV